MGMALASAASIGLVLGVGAAGQTWERLAGAAKARPAKVVMAGGRGQGRKPARCAACMTIVAAAQGG
jgi:hypothetical protein